MKTASIVVIAALFASFFVHQPAPQQGTAAIAPYPAGYRAWTHVKSGAIVSGHRNFATNGGFQHIYANAQAMAGYRTRSFPEGSVIAVDWLESVEKDGALQEGPRRQVDVMVKDSKRFASTGGWGF